MDAVLSKRSIQSFRNKAFVLKLEISANLPISEFSYRDNCSFSVSFSITYVRGGRFCLYATLLWSQNLEDRLCQGLMEYNQHQKLWMFRRHQKLLRKQNFLRP